MKYIVFFAIFVLALGGKLHYKHLAGPPEEFKDHIVPDPQNTLTVEESDTERIWFKPLGDNIIYDQDIPVDGPNQFSFLFASPYEGQLELTLTDPKGNVVDISKFANKEPFPIGDDKTIPVTTYVLSDTIQGTYHMTIMTTGFTEAEIIEMGNQPEPNAIIIVLNNDYVEMQSHMSSYVIREGSTFGLVSRVVDVSPQNRQLDIHISSAMMNIRTPNGQDLDIPMHDDGVAGDVMANDGWFTAIVPTQIAGDYLAEANVIGYFTGPGLADAVAFKRSTQHVLAVSGATAKLGAKAVLRNLDSDRYALDISVDGDAKQPTLRAYAEVWGNTASGELIAACWVGGVVEISNGLVSLELNKNWLVRAGVTGSLTLRNVHLSDMSTSFPIDIAAADIPVGNSGNLREIAQKHWNFVKNPAQFQITKEMLYGVNPLANITKMKSAAATFNLVLLPGYCSTNNPFLRSKDAFPTGTFFIGQGYNLANDEYSKKVMDWIDTQPVGSFGIIGHSQGGMVSLHIHNFYFTGLEEATGGRVIQSVGTPWQGTSAAGSAAGLGAVFGVGCGSSVDLSRDGAINWQTGISAASRADVYYYTSTYKTGNFFGDYCSLPMNLLLQYPNDGTTELKYATLDGGNNMGNKEKWCHAMNMAYPPQSDDPERNIDLNKLAAH